MTEEKKEDQAVKLLGEIRRELRDIRGIQQTTARNFNAVVVMIIFGVLMLLVNLFLGDIIRRQMADWVMRTEEGRVVGEQFEQLERALK